MKQKNPGKTTSATPDRKETDMKKKHPISIILCVALILVSLSIAVLIFTNHEALASLFSGESIEKTIGVYTLVNLILLFAVWVLFFVVLYKFGKSDSVTFSRTDPLTGIGNKKQARLNYESSSSLYGKCLCLAYFAFDEAKIRERFGTVWSEKLQKSAADTLSSACGDYDCAARIGEGEFLMSIHCKGGLMAEKAVRDAVEELNKQQFRMLLEGAAPFHAGLFLADGKTDFDTACANAKTGYRYACDLNETAFICTRDILVKEASRDRLREKLNSAIDAGEFDPYLQFVYDVKKGGFIGAEVLSRWNSPVDGLKMPAYYIGSMCSTGVIEKFDLYMLSKTCALLESFAGTEYEPLQLSCNITRISVSSEDFAEKVKAILKKYHFDRSHLIIEITEDVFIRNHNVAFRNITECRKEGIRIAIDDFGTGNSSFGDIGDYPVDELKVDREIILKTETERGNALLQGLIGLAHQLGIEVVCEGVETDGQRDCAVENGTDFIQGYFYSYVFPVEEGKRHYKASLAQ